MNKIFIMLVILGIAGGIFAWHQYSAPQNASAGFSMATVKVGDKVGSLTVAEIGPFNSSSAFNSRIVFNGTAIWKGKVIDFRNTDAMVAGLFIEVSHEYVMQVPEATDAPQTSQKQFLVENPEIFGSSIQNGDLVEVQINQYISVHAATEATDSATVTSIRKVEE